MTIQDAKSSIGKKFRVVSFTGGIVGSADTIIKVENNIIHGRFIEAKCEDCRFVGPQPEHLKKKK